MLAKIGWEVNIHTSKDVYLEKNCLPETDQVRGLNVKRYPFKWHGFIPKMHLSNGSILALHNFDIFPHFLTLLYVSFIKLIGYPAMGFGS